jgi:hypothetical protein
MIKENLLLAGILIIACTTYATTKKQLVKKIAEYYPAGIL